MFLIPVIVMKLRTYDVSTEQKSFLEISSRRNAGGKKLKIKA